MLHLTNLKKTLLSSVFLSVLSQGAFAEISLSDEFVDLKSNPIVITEDGKSVILSPMGAAPMAATSSSNPSYGSTAFTVASRGMYYTGSMATSAPFGSTVAGITYTLNVYGIDPDDAAYTFVYLCRNEGVQCKQVLGTGTGTSGAWDGDSTWAGATTLSPGWEYWVGVQHYEGESYLMDSFSVQGSVSMGWQ